MKKIGIIGHKEFLGMHLQWFLAPYSDEIEVLLIDESLDISSNDTKEALKVCDVVVHLKAAHAKNSPEEEIYARNLEMSKRLIEICDRFRVTPHIIYASSTQIYTETIYGRSKRDVGNMLVSWGKAHNTPVSLLVIPNEFGEFGKPFDVSVVSTFCHHLVNGESSEINQSASVDLVHNQEIAQTILDIIRNPKGGEIEIKGENISLTELHSLLVDFYNLYSKDIVPTLKNKFHTALFNTLRSHLFGAKFYPRKLILHNDERGGLVETLKTGGGGQIFISTTKPQYTRGNHYHTRKVERFCVIKGVADIKIKNLFFGNETTIRVSGDNPVYIDMPTFCAHNLKNVGEGELMTMFWINEIFNPSDPDTFPFVI